MDGFGGYRESIGDPLRRRGVTVADRLEHVGVVHAGTTTPGRKGLAGGGVATDVTHDELAGVVDLFGALTREELAEARSELAFRQGEEEPDPAAVDAALEEYALVEHEGLLVAGPAAFPTLPPEASDLPYIVDVPEREVDHEEIGERVRDDLLAAVERDDPERLRELSYDLEAWAPVDASDVRARLESEGEES